MKTLFFKSIISFLLVLVAFSCNNNQKLVIENDIKFDSLMINKTYHMMDNEINPECSLQIKFIYPTFFTDRNILSLLQYQFISSYFGEQYAELTPEDAVKNYIENSFNDFKLQENDFLTDQYNHQEKPDESWYAYNENSSNEIIYNENNVLSLVINKEFYKGGAHNAHSYLNYVYNLESGKPIKENEIFIDDYQEELAKIIIKEIATLNKLNDINELENIGFFNIDEIYPNKNFYVDANGITYTFNEYEIAAYIVGPIFVHLSFEKIKHLLRNDSPVSKIAF